MSFVATLERYHGDIRETKTEWDTVLSWRSVHGRREEKRWNETYVVGMDGLSALMRIAYLTHCIA